MKKFLMTMFVFFLLALPNLAGAQGVADPIDCSSVELTTCDMIVFGGENEDGETSVLLAQRFDPNLTPGQIVSTLGIMEYIEGFNRDQQLFTVDGEDTVNFQNYVGPTFLSEAYNYRVIVGTSTLLGYPEQAVMLIAAANDQAYVFFIVGTHEGFGQYVDSVVSEDDMTLIPEGMEPLSEGDGMGEPESLKHIISNIR